MACPVCGRPLPAGARFCPSCGASVGGLLGTEERKMVTVLFADIVDSTGLARRLDPERAREVLGRFFDAATEELQALRGRPEKFIGDAVMAVFGLPQVNEDDALRAIRAGLAIRGRTQRLAQDAGLEEALQVRVGVEAGEAATGVGPAGQLLVTGSVVNTAARLQSAALPNQVLAGTTAHALTTNKVSFGRRRRFKAKGFDVPLDAFPVEGLTNRSTRRTIPFVNRVSEQAILGQSLGLASTTGKPVLVTIVGEPGIGKSRLAEELAAGMSATVRILRGQPRGFEDSSTFSPAAAIVGDLACIESTDSPEAIRRCLRELVDTAGVQSNPARTADWLGLLFGVSERREESAFVHDVQAGFIALIDALSRDHPVALLFEDVHTMRPAMQDLIERLGTPSRRGPRRALVLALGRSELLDERPAWGSASGNAVLIRLDPLSTDESIRLVRNAAGGQVSDVEASEIAMRAGGNPFFIIETTGMLMADGNGSGPPSRVVPPTVHAVVSARLDALPTRLRDLARRVSVFMYGFDMGELAIVDPEATQNDLEQLEEAEVLVQVPTGPPEDRWRMRHSMLKEVAYASLPKRERLRLHRLVAEKIAAAGHTTAAADHLYLAALASLDLDPMDRTAANQAADALLKSGDRARRRMESRSAVDRYQRALTMSGPERGWGLREARILAGMGEARYWLGEYPAALEVLNRAVQVGESCDDTFSLALALRFLGDVAINYEGDVEKAEMLLQRSLEAAERLGDSWAVVRSLLFSGWVPWTRYKFEEAEAIWRRALDMAAPDDSWARVRALTALSINRTEMKDLEGSLQLIEEAGRLAEECGDQFSVAMTYVQKARLFDELGRREEALPWFDQGIAIFSELGARWEMADARAARGITKREMGHLDEAEDDLRFAIRIAEELGDRQIPGWTWRALARVSELRGDQAEADERHRRSREALVRGPH